MSGDAWQAQEAYKDAEALAAAKLEIERLRAELSELRANLRTAAHNLKILAGNEQSAKSVRGLFKDLTPEQQKEALEYRGPENFGYGQSQNEKSPPSV